MSWTRSKNYIRHNAKGYDKEVFEKKTFANVLKPEIYWVHTSLIKNIWGKKCNKLSENVGIDTCLLIFCNYDF